MFIPSYVVINFTRAYIEKTMTLVPDSLQTVSLISKMSRVVTAKLISAFVFATRIVQFLFLLLNPKFQVSSLLL